MIWDTAGEERFKSFATNIFGSANGILLLYNVTSQVSFENLNSCLTEIKKYANKDICMILVGTNCNLEDERKITYKEGEDFAINNGMKFIEVSAKDNINVNEAFEILVEDIYNSYSNNSKVDEQKDKHPLPENDKKEKKCNII